MARQFHLTTYMCLLVVAAVSAADEQASPAQGGSAPNELNLVTPGTNDQPSPSNDNQAIPVQPDSSSVPSVPVSPSGSTEVAPTNLDNNQQGEMDQDDYQQPQPFSPFGIFDGFRPQPPQPFNQRPSGSLFDLFGGNLFDSIRRQSEMMNHQFSQLESQAAEGKSVSYFNRNGVAYMKTCTVERVRN